MFAIQTAGDFDVDVYHAGELHGPRAQEAMAKFVMISGTTCHQADREQGLHHTGAIRGMRRFWHEAAARGCPLNGRYRVISRLHMLDASSSLFDPHPTWADLYRVFYFALVP